MTLLLRLRERMLLRQLPESEWLRADALLVLRRGASLDGLPTSLAQARAAELGQVLRSRPEKSVLRLEQHGHRAKFLKRYHYSRPYVFLVALLKANFPCFSGPVELTNLLALEAAGFRVPRPLAAGSGGSLLRAESFVLMTTLAGASLEDLLAADGLRLEGIERIRLAEELGEWLARLHDAGFRHHDLYLCHIFWDAKEGLGLLDCERVTRSAKGVSARVVVKELGALLYSAAGLTSPWERARFLVAYGRGAGWTRAERRGLRGKIMARAERVGSRGRKG